jgi:hypothetical protein
MREETTTRMLYQFDELSDSAKERARDWFRKGDVFISVHIIEDAKRIGSLMGIQIDKVYYSGFASQGDGACFEGSYSYKKGSVKAVKSYAPTDEKLHVIVEELAAIQKRNGYKLEASVKHRGHYHHSRCTDIEVTLETLHGTDWPALVEAEALTDALRSFMDWIYRQLEAAYEYQNSDEAVDENIRINEYEFTEDGRRA